MGGKRILLIEDNAVNRRLAQFLLKSQGYEVWEVASAPEAFESLKERRPDLILMDIQLPGMDGLTATRQLKADPATREIPVLVVTRTGSEEGESGLPSKLPLGRRVGSRRSRGTPLPSDDFPEEGACRLRRL
jgi:CheY-like chemotaxis protein